LFQISIGMRLLILLTCLFTSYTLVAQYQTPPILWSKKSLHWKDFKLKPDSSKLAGKWGAATSSWVEERYMVTPQHEIRFIIRAWFNPDLSWKKDAASPYGLRHEQYHFNMSELYARKMKMVLSSIELTDSNYKQEISQLLKNFHDQYRLQQIRYDEETEHSRNMLMQYNWMESIDVEMKTLSPYSDSVLVVKIRK
jgi:predicted HNH restriction endonuclease